MSWKPRDVAAVVVAASVSVALVITSFVPIFTGQPISEKRSELIVGLLMALVAGIVAYITNRGE